MANINFPSSPVNNQQYTLNGVYYVYDATLGAWITSIIPSQLATSIVNQQIIFNDSSMSNGSNGMIFSKTANTVYLSNVVVTQNVTAVYFKGSGSFLSNIVSDTLGATIYNTANAAFDKANTGSSVTTNWLIKSANYTANVGDKIYCNTLPGFVTITLPASPGTGNNVTISSGYNASNANVTVARNGSTIMGIAENLVITDNNLSVEFIYDGSSWRIG